MSRQQEFIQKIKIEADMEIAGVKKGIEGIESAFKGLKMDKGLESQLDKLKKDLGTFEKFNGKEIGNKMDASAFSKSWKTLAGDLDDISRKLEKMGLDPSKFIPNTTLTKLGQVQKTLDNLTKARTTRDTAISKLSQQSDEAKNKLEQLNREKQELESGKYTDTGLEELESQARQASIELKDLKKIKEEMNKTGTSEESVIADENYDKQKEYVQQLNAEIKNYKKNLQEVPSRLDTITKETEELESKTKEYDGQISEIKKKFREDWGSDSGLAKVREELSQFTDKDISHASLDQLKKLVEQLAIEAGNDAAPKIAQLGEALNQLSGETKSAGADLSHLGNDVDEASGKAQDFTNQVNSLANQVTNFFSLTNGWHLLRRAIHSAIDAVSELDEAMTGIAVVSEYDLSDIWGMRTEFSKQASEVGVSTLDMVNATTLYTQQGLELADAMQVATETMKMGRIAGLQGEEATELMTAALRGYNMELSEAAHVNDVYSNLAAKSASNQEQLATAMSKTASIAYNSGASFENMSAFLAQIIETTQEAPETAGTAMKTIIARFQELKKPLSEIGEVEGEVVDANKIEGALRLAGVALRDANGEFRDFDDVILELSSKWDTLDKMTQRYIATQAAGSRQQSRFLALLDNNERLLELTGYAADSAGKSQEQFGKTIESFQTKVNQLKNQMTQFYTNLLNSNVVKGAVDILTKIMETVNKLFTGMADNESIIVNITSTILQLVMALTTFSLAQKAVNGAVNKAVKGLSTLGIVGKEASEGFLKSRESASLFSTALGMISKAPEKLKKIPIFFKGMAGRIKGNIDFVDDLSGSLAEAGIKGGIAGDKIKDLLLTLKAAAPAIGIIGALIAAAVVAYRLINKQQIAYNKSLEKTNKLLEESKDLREEFTDTESTGNVYEEGIKGLEELTKETEEYKQAIQDSNEEAKKLIETLDLYGNYTIDSDGLIKIDEESLASALVAKEQEVLQSEIDAQRSQMETSQLSYSAQVEQFQNKFGRTNTIGFTDYSGESTRTELGKNIEKIVEGSAKIWKDGQKSLLDIAVQQALDNADELSDSQREMLRSVFGNYDTDLLQTYVDNQDAVDELTKTYINSQKEIEAATHEFLKSVYEKAINDNPDLDTSEWIESLLEKYDVEIPENSINEAVTRILENNTNIKNMTPEEQQAEVEKRAPALFKSITQAIEKSLDINIGNFGEVLRDGIFEGELDASKIIGSAEELEAMKDMILNDTIPEEILVVLKDLGIDIEGFRKDVLALMPEDLINNLAAQAGTHNTSAKTIQSDIEDGKLTYGALVNGEYGEEETEKLNNLLNYINQLKEIYPQLSNEVDLLNQKWLIGTQEYSNALSSVQQQLTLLEVGNLQNELKSMTENLVNTFGGDGEEIDFTAHLDDAQFQTQIQEIENQKHTIQFKLEEQASQELNKLQTLSNKVGNVFDILKEDFSVTADELQQIMEIYPEVIDYIEGYADGEVLLSESIEDAIVPALNSEIEAQQDSTNSWIDGLITKNNAEIEFWKGLLDVINAGNGDVAINQNTWNEHIEGLNTELQDANIDIKADEVDGVTAAMRQIPIEADTVASQENIAMAAGAQGILTIQDTMGAKLAQSWSQISSMAGQAMNPYLEKAGLNIIGGKAISYDPVSGEIVSTYVSQVDKFAAANAIREGAKAAAEAAKAATGNKDYYDAGGFAALLNAEVNGYNGKTGAEGQKAYIEDRIKALEDANKRLKGMKYLGEAYKQEASNKGSNIGSGSGSGSGGGGGGSEENPWIADYDWLYNLLKKINAEEKKMNKLEKERERLLRNQSLNVKKMTDNYKARMDLIKQEKIDNQALLAGRMQEMVNLQSNNKDMLKYGYYDQEEGYFKINYDAIMAVSGQISESEGKLIDEYIKEGEKLSEDIQDINETIDDLKDEEYKIWEQGHSAMADLEQGVIDGIVSEREKEIEKLQQVYDSINEANQNIIDALNSGIEEYRNQRELDRQLEDIQDQESRIALMSMDTSGANQLDILNAQKELDDARESYTDSLIDKSIEQMTEQNETAEKQRQHQIDLMTAQLEWDKENGLIVSLMEKLLTAAENGDDKALKEIQRLLNDGKTWSELAKMVGQATLDNMKSETKGKVEDAIGWHLANHSLEKLDNFDDLIKKKISFTDKNGKTVSGKVQSDGSVKTSDYKYTGIYQGVDGKYYQSDEGAKTKLKKTTNTSSTKDIKDIKDSSKEKTTTISKNATKRTMDKYGWSETEDINHGIAEVIMTYGGEGSGWGNGSTRDSRINAKNKNQASKVQSLINQMSSGQISGHWHEPDELKKYFYAKFETGGLADFTGPAWLDGTKSKPEYVLNAEQTQKFFDLLDFTRNIATDSKSTSLGDTYVTVQMNNEISSDYDVDEMWEEMKRKIAQESNYRNVNVLDFNRR